MTGFERILRRLGKKHAVLLEILSRGKIDSVTANKLRHVCRLLDKLGVIETDEFGITLSELGRSLIARHRDQLCPNATSDTGELLESLLPRETVKKEIRKKDLEFLIFLSAVGRPLNEIRRAKALIPGLVGRGLIEIRADNVQLTELGAQKLGQHRSVEHVTRATEYFLSQPKIAARQRNSSRADEFIQLRKQGIPLDEIGRRYGLSKQRVAQILRSSPNFSSHLEELQRRKEENAQEVARLKKLRKLERSLANQFPERVDQLWDPEKNVGMDPLEISAKSASVQVWWKCPIDNYSWKRSPNQISSSWVRSGTSGCPRCAGKLTRPVRHASLAEEYPEYVRKYWDTDRNTAINQDPERITLASNRRIWLLCPIHKHSWETKVHSCVRQQWSKGNSGCRICNGTYNRRVGEWEKAEPLAVKFPEQVQIYWDFEANAAIGLDPAKVTSGSAKTAHFICPIDDYHWCAPVSAIGNSWSRGNSGCPACRGFVTTAGLSLQGLYPSYVQDYWDFARNLEIDPQSLTPKSKEKANFICVEHQTSWVEPIRNLTKNYWAKGESGCPTCCPGRREKKGRDHRETVTENTLDVFPTDLSNLLELLSYSTSKPRRIRHEIITLACEIEISSVGSANWGRPNSATRRLKILESLNTQRDEILTQSDVANADTLLRDISFVRSEFF